MIKIIILVILLYLIVNKILIWKTGKLKDKGMKLKKENDELKAMQEKQDELKDFLEKLQQLQDDPKEESRREGIQKKIEEGMKKEIAYETAVMDIKQFNELGIKAPNSSIDHFIKKLYKENPEKNH